ncbi:hypothetical protein COUCH_05745 [Couchioplanes caeruleus]|uniref:hypothetical protein n=1 Tax=Couchioplanes caeruleus TaxID=56438 RepID=UPI0020BEEEEE|nr:hypothetical protein [Couchioplanes caeruleus]UQU65818.1 hypothetical protein COUCH_05745 [Couchioplanes caeruleus]
MKIRKPRRSLLIPWIGSFLLFAIGFGLAIGGARYGAAIGAAGGVLFVILGVLIFAKTPRT